MHFRCCIYRYVVLSCQMAYSLDVVGMVVCNKYGFYLIQIYAVFLKNLFY